MGIITLLTDFGIKDGNVALMKGVIWRIAPQVQIADLCHMVQPQNVNEAALILFHAAPYYPPYTIHVVVVDPGVGTTRRAIAVRLGDQFFVGPDNGVITLFLEHANKHKWRIDSVTLDKPQFWLPEVSNVFHGRDIFAPVAAHIGNGKKIEDVGTISSDELVCLKFPKPKKVDNRWVGDIIHIDHFGNIVTNIYKEHLGNLDNIVTTISDKKIQGITSTFGDRTPGETIALYGSDNQLIISMVNGNAAKLLGSKVGEIVDVLVLKEGEENKKIDRNDCS